MMFYVKCNIPRLMSLPDSSVTPTPASLIRHANHSIAIFLDAQSSRERDLRPKNTPT